MKTFRDEGITFKVRNVNEADQIISVLTKYHGRIDAISKGVRKLASRKRGNYDLLTLSRFSFFKGSNLDIVLEAELKKNFFVGKSHITTIPFLNLCAVLDKLIHVGVGNKGLFLFLLETLKNFGSKNYKLFLIWFYLKLLILSGFEPNLNTCLICDNQFKERTVRFISKREIGFYCAKHSPEKENIITDNALKVLKFLRANDASDINKLKIYDTDMKILSNAIHIWIKIVAGESLKIKNVI